MKSNAHWKVTLEMPEAGRVTSKSGYGHAFLARVLEHWTQEAGPTGRITIEFGHESFKGRRTPTGVKTDVPAQYGIS